ncbi:hypothetical protein LZG75_03415 [Polynucleobacter sp. IMCC30063]|uniref:hypothetical protein n=1 Tax=Polynucleobacter sp. IMCC30063 TaxID=2907298 RepID=UPI001F29839D|nr:hypothetical protein [Polynucleobacter sp. IMCC30063]MCE7505279.1 hypothetical protein [Polynucleobacter sp. IMCC30063]
MLAKAMLILNKKKSVNHLIKFLQYLFLILLLGLIVGISYRRPIIPWDSWAYHLPFTAALWNINNFRDVFIMDEGMLNRFHGFPLALDWMRGIFWKISNDVRATVLLSSLSFSIFVLATSIFFRLNPLLFLIGLLTFPQISIHIFSTYSDLPFGILIATQFVIAIAIERYFLREKLSKINSFALLFGFILSTALSGNSKMWGPILNASIITFLFLYALIYYRINKNKLIILFIVCFFSMMLSCFTIIKNTINHNNPFYPITFSIPLSEKKLIGPEPQHDASPAYAMNLSVLEKPIYFLFSITEFDWNLRGINNYYSLDSAPGENPKKYGKARTGGWWGVYLGFNFIALFAIWLYAVKYNRMLYAKLKFSVAMYGFFLLSISLLPQSHELRYFLCIPILLIFLINDNLKYLKLTNNYFLLIYTTYLCFFLYSFTYLSGEDIRDDIKNKGVFSILSRKKNDEIYFPQYVIEIVDAKKNGGICLGPEYSPNQLKYSAIFVGGSYVIEQSNSKCRFYDQYLGTK